MNYENWPWGEQNCTYTAGSWTYDMAQVDIQPYLGYTEADKQDTPLNFEHLLSKDKVSKYSASYSFPNICPFME